MISVCKESICCGPRVCSSLLQGERTGGKCPIGYCDYTLLKIEYLRPSSLPIFIFVQRKEQCQKRSGEWQSPMITSNHTMPINWAPIGVDKTLAGTQRAILTFQ